MNKLRWLAVLALTTGGCTEPQGPDPVSGSETARAVAESHRPRVPLSAERAALRAADLAHSAASRSLPQGFLRYLKYDAVFLFPNAPWVQGKEAIAALLTAPPGPFVPGISLSSRQGGTAVLSWVPKLSDVGPRGDLGWSMGEYTITGQLGTGYGKYLSVWRKNDRGRWKFVQDAGSSNPQPGE